MKSELRRPNSDPLRPAPSAARRSPKPELRIDRAASLASVFGLRISFGFRISVFGFFLLTLLSQPSTLHAQPAPSPNRVLDLDGTGDYVRLPAAGYTNFHQATIEAWVKWRNFNSS